jgi:hypothetical protein
MIIAVSLIYTLYKSLHLWRTENLLFVILLLLVPAR